MYHLKFVNRKGHVPHESLMVECDSFRKKWVQVHVGESLEKYSPSIGATFWPFEEEMNNHKLDTATTVLIVNVFGAAGFNWIVGRDMILFVMNFDGKTIDKTIV